MTRARILVVLLAACWLACGARGSAAPLDDLEAQVRAAVERRKAAEGERSRLIQEAAGLAGAIRDAQPPLGGAGRAGSALERRLRDFDRVAAQLDASDRTLRSLDADVARLRRAFDAEFERESRELQGRSSSAALARAAELAAARRRIDQLSTPPPAFRALLVVRPAPTDTVPDLDQKLAILSTEQSRGNAALAAVERDLTILDARLLVTRRLLEQLDAAARGAPQDLRLVQRQADDVQQRLRDIDQERTTLGQLRDTIRRELAEVERDIAECRARRAALISPR